jgi:hypothetical protein
VAKNPTKALDNLVLYRLNIIETDFRLGKTTLFKHYQIFAVVKVHHTPSPGDGGSIGLLYYTNVILLFTSQWQWMVLGRLLLELPVMDRP